MRTRLLALLPVLAFAVGCTSPTTAPTPVSVAPVDARPAGVTEMTTAPAAAVDDCDRESSLRPGPLPPPDAMPPDTTMADIYDRGRLIVGVDQAQFLFGARNPATGRLEGFDIDIAREMARAIFGDPERIELRVVDAGDREEVLQAGEVDLVVRTFSISCERKQDVAFSTVYFYADQRILVSEGSGISSATDLEGKLACAVSDTTSAAKLYALDPRPVIIGAPTWPDCLVMLQQGQIDAIGTDAVVLAGLAEQDPSVEIVGDSLGREPYGIGINLDNEDLVRFVNGVLERLREEGIWEDLYTGNERLLAIFGPQQPPTPQYLD
ncbi:MAG: glutamate ABC transporter substrate-binding protein [Mycobacterium sp.]